MRQNTGTKGEFDDKDNNNCVKNDNKDNNKFNTDQIEDADISLFFTGVSYLNNGANSNGNGNSTNSDGSFCNSVLMPSHDIYRLRRSVADPYHLLPLLQPVVNAYAAAYDDCILREIFPLCSGSHNNILNNSSCNSSVNSGGPDSEIHVNSLWGVVRGINAFLVLIKQEKVSLRLRWHNNNNSNNFTSIIKVNDNGNYTGGFRPVSMGVFARNGVMEYVNNNCSVSNSEASSNENSLVTMVSDAISSLCSPIINAVLNTNSNSNNDNHDNSSNNNLSRNHSYNSNYNSIGSLLGRKEQVKEHICIDPRTKLITFRSLSLGWCFDFA